MSKVNLKTPPAKSSLMRVAAEGGAPRIQPKAGGKRLTGPAVAEATDGKGFFLFSLSSYHRKPEFQTQTLVFSHQVIKNPLHPNAASHLQNQLQIAQTIKKHFPQLPLLQPLPSSTPDSLTFPFQPHPTLASLIEKSLLTKDFTQALPLFDLYLELLNSLLQKEPEPPPDSLFPELFQPPPKTLPGLIDLTCANLFFTSKLKTVPGERFSRHSQKRNASVLKVRADHFLPIEPCSTAVTQKTASWKGYRKPPLLAFDQEWLLSNLHLDLLLFRNLLDLAARFQSLIHNFCSPAFPCYQINHQLLIPQLWFDHFQLDPQHLLEFYRWEQDFQNFLNQQPNSFPPLLLNQATGQFPLLTSSPQEPSPPQKIARLQNQVDALTTQLDQSQKALHQLSAFHQSKFDKLARLATRPNYYLGRFITQEKDFLKQNSPRAYFPRIQNRLGRRHFIQALQSAKPSPISSPPKILIIAGAPNTVAHIHRVDHLEEKLQLLKLTYLTIPQSSLTLTPRPATLANFDLLYIHRATLDLPLQALLDSFRLQNKPIIFDIDDLVFDTAVLPAIATSQNLSPEITSLYQETMLRHQDVMRQATLLVTPTQYLSDYASQFFNLPAAVLPNHLDQNSLDLGRRLGQAHLSRPAPPPGRLRLGYFPGTATHNHDFAVVAPALLRLLAAHPLLALRVVGYLDLPPAFDPFLASGQVQLLPAVPYSELIDQYANLDLNLAPLKSATEPFCAGKSELKYFFAGICGLPTIATPTPPFADALTRSRGGRLAATPANWYRQLNAFLRSPKSLSPLAKRAFRDCQKTYSPTEQAKILKKILISLNFSIPR